MTHKPRTTRRDLVKNSAAATLGFTIVPSCVVPSAQGRDGQRPPSGKLNFAAVGVGGRGVKVITELCKGGKAQPVAFCDVDFGVRGAAKILKQYPDVPRFKDFRVMLEKMGKHIDAVSVATPDHTHFPAAMLAMAMGKHVFVEKPLTHSYREADLLMRAEKKFGVVTQMGNQGHTSAGSAQFEQLVEKGVVRDITRVDAWKTPGLFFMNAKKRFAKFRSGETPPATLDWDLWCGPAAVRPFSARLHPFDWRGFWLYGNGMLGDWGAHIIDFAHDFLELGQPHTLTPHLMEDHNDVLFPLRSQLTMQFPERGRHPALQLTWRDGAGCIPKVPEQFHEAQKDGSRKPPRLGGAGTVLYRKDGDFAIARGSHWGTSRVISKDRAAEYKEAFAVKGPKLGHYASFVAACMGEGKTRSPFRIGGELTKTLMLGIICQRLNEELRFDPKRERFRGNARADLMLEGPEPRKGWGEFYEML